MTENIALIFQEVFTRIVRLRSGQLNRQNFPNAEAVRFDASEAVREAVGRAREAGYKVAEYSGGVRNDGSNGDVEMCTLAAVGLLDQTFLDIGGPMATEWRAKPLTEVLFGHNRHGEYFFKNLETLLRRDDSPTLADLLELHLLCLQLGFAGVDNQDFSRGKRQEIAMRIQRIRGPLGSLSPKALPTGATGAPRPSGGVRPYMIAAIAFLLVTIGLFAAFRLSLGSGVSDVKAIAAGRG